MSWRTATIVTIMLAATTIAACASSSGKSAEALARRADCVLRPQDSVFLERGPVFRDCDVDTKAKLTTTGIHPDYHAPNNMPNGCYSADLEYVVNTAGEIETSTARVVRASDDELAQAMVSILPQLRFEPALRNGAPVRAIVAVHYAVAFARVSVPSGTRPTAPPRGSVQTKC